MPSPTVITASDKEIASKVLQTILKCQNDAIDKHGNFNVAVSGGVLPDILTPMLLACPDIKWDKTKLYFTDENLVPFDSPESNYGNLKRRLLDKLTVKPRVFAIDEALVAAGASAQEIADKYAHDLDRSLHTSPVFVSLITGESRLVPKFDLVFMDCTAEGNTGAFFSGHEALKETSKTVLGIEDAPQGCPRRITLTKPVLEASAKIGIIAMNKQPFVDEVLACRDHTLPAHHINHVSRSSVHWFVID